MNHDAFKYVDFRPELMTAEESAALEKNMDRGSGNIFWMQVAEWVCYIIQAALYGALYYYL